MYFGTIKFASEYRGCGNITSRKKTLVWEILK